MQAKLSQPRGLSIFFLTEMWERYGFYVVQGLLVLFLSEKFQFSDKQSYAILGSYSALVYISSIIGGYLADSALGYRHAVILGGMLLFVGYASLAYSYDPQYFYLSLAFLIMGTGLFKPNVSSMLGTLYNGQDNRRDAGYTIFYVGINIGSILATVSSGYVVQYFSWQASFGVAAAVIVIGITTFTIGTAYFNIRDPRQIQYRYSKYLYTYVGIGLLIAFNAFLIQNSNWALAFFGLVCLAIVFIIGITAYREEERQRKRLFAYLLLLLISVVFWAIFFQVFFSLDLFVNRVVSHDFFGFYIPPPLFISVESIGVILIGPFLGKIWTALNQRNLNVSLPAKFTLGMGFLTLTFALLYYSVIVSPGSHVVMWYWLALAYLALAIGDLCLSPMGLVMAVELAPPRLVGMMMGIFFVSLGIGGKLAGILADYAAIPDNVKDIAQIKLLYQHAFLTYTAIAFGATVIALLFTPFIKRLIKREHETMSDMPLL